MFAQGPASCRSNGLFGLGVADGVYMWAKLGIDSGEFSRALMDTAKRATEGGTADVLNGAPHAMLLDGQCHLVVSAARMRSRRELFIPVEQVPSPLSKGYPVAALPMW